MTQSSAPRPEQKRAKSPVFQIPLNHLVGGVLWVFSRGLRASLAHEMIEGEVLTMLRHCVKAAYSVNRCNDFFDYL